MPPTIAGLEGTCVLLPCRFDYPEELRPAAVHGLWYFGNPYPKSYPPVVARSRPGGPVHESFEGRARLLGAPRARDCSLLLTGLSPELAGRYYFRGDLGGYNQYTFSEHATLEVTAEPSLELPEELVAGQEAEATCRVPDNCPGLGPALAWAGAEELPEAAAAPARPLEAPGGSRSLVARLRFRPRPGDGGRRLACRLAYANASLAAEAAVALDVQYPPEVEAVAGPAEAVEGAAVELACAARGRPPPLLAWLRGGRVLREAAGERLALPLPRVAPAHGGAYVCVAENRHGRHNRSLELRVRYPPRAPVVNGSAVVAAGEPVTVACSAESDPAPIVRVLKGGRVVAAAVYEPRVALELAAARPEDAGEYLCLAENQYGQQGTAFNVTVEFAPVVLPESRCTAGREAVQCVCAVAASPPAAVAFELPSRNATVGPGAAAFAFAPEPRAGTTVTALLTLRGALEPRLAVLCAARNARGTAARQLRFHHPDGLVWAKVGPVGAVVAFAVVIAVVCYVSQTRRK
ncbi:LOW QUALITY PROTEIN: Schwann cell myelin protein-like [Apteryx mantelli]|uniref:LOW QUALITY PROTEIN: Schwann cell myelin protein-like n=1 Tax=Apteryx mantelli TaxID=2696672 RepID=A0ABM4G8N2_9AVES